MKLKDVFLGVVLVASSVSPVMAAPQGVLTTVKDVAPPVAFFGVLGMALYSVIKKTKPPSP